MAFNRELAKTRSDAFRANISSRSTIQQDIMNQFLVFANTAAELNVAVRWTSNTVSNQRNFININIGEMDLDFRSAIVRLLLEYPVPNFPTKSFKVRAPLVAQDVNKFMKYLNDFWISDLAALMTLDDTGITLFWATDSNDAPEYLDLEAGEMDEEP